MIRTLVLVVMLLQPVLSNAAVVRGHVMDPSGAIVPGAKVTLVDQSGQVRTTMSLGDGAYSFTDAAPGEYEVAASAPDLALREPVKITVTHDPLEVDLHLQVVLASQQVAVQDSTDAKVTPDPSMNASATILKGEDLQALSDDPTDLAADLQALAGPAAGPNGGQIYIDGFSGGQIPSKDSIREIRINQNPFSPEYDKLGFGRVEIFTKPGSDKYRGTAFYNFGDDFWNSRNPYAAKKAPFLLREYGGNVGGPLNGRSSFFIDIRRDATDNGSIINAVTLDPTTFAITPFTGVYDVAQRALRVSPRADFQLSPNHTLTLRYGYTQMDVPGAGTGSFNLTSRGYDVFTWTHTAQITETAVIGPNAVNEFRFQYFGIGTQDRAFSPAAAIQVLGAFNGGGAQTGNSSDRHDNYELQEYVSLARGVHTWRFGVRVRGEVDSNTALQNFGGTFTFGGGIGPELDANNRPVLDALGQPVMTRVQSIEQYRRTLLFQKLGYPATEIRALGGGATQFSIAAGQTALTVGQFDVGAFAGDDWRVRPNLTLSAGLRYETQSNIHDWRDLAPRIGMAWAPGTRGNKRGKTVVRAGFGLFYDRFSLANTLAAARFNGVVQRQLIVSNPDFFPSVPLASALEGAQGAAAIQRVSSRLRAPYIMQSAVGVEREVTVQDDARLDVCEFSWAAHASVP